MTSAAAPPVRHAFVTGASKGIGRAIAERIAAAGGDVAITARDAGALADVAQALDAAHPGRVVGIPCDVRDEAAVHDAVRHATELFGGLDLVVANAGVGRFASVPDLTSEDWHAVIDTNLTGVFHTAKATLPALEASEGLLVTIGSLAGANFFAGGAAYNASKFGLLGFTQALMLDVRDRGVRVSTIMPGSVATPFSGREPTDADAWKIQPEDVATLVMDLATMPARTLPSRIEVRPSRPPKR